MAKKRLLKAPIKPIRIAPTLGLKKKEEYVRKLKNKRKK